MPLPNVTKLLLVQFVLPIVKMVIKATTQDTCVICMADGCQRRTQHRAAVSYGVFSVDCGSLTAVLGPTAVVKTVTGTTYRSTGIAACKSGYNGGQSTFVCEADGTWHGQLECDAVNCGPNIRGLDEHAVAKCVGNTMFGGDPCVASCVAGYEGGSAKYVCTDRGVWDGYLQCKKRRCDTVIPGLDPNAIVTVFGTLYGDKVRARCPDGYDGGETDFVCGINGWEGSIKCTPRNCGPLGPLLDPNSISDCGESNPFGGQACTARCKEGYIGGPGHFICGPDGKWIGKIKCDAINCGPPESALGENVVVLSKSTGTSFRSTFTAACAAGYEGEPGYKSGQAQYYCGEDGRWRGDLKCKELCPQKTMSLTVSHKVNGCSMALEYEMSNYSKGGKLYYTVAERMGGKTSAQQVMQGGQGVCSGSFNQVDDLRHVALVGCDFQRGKDYTLNIAIDSDGNGKDLALSHNIRMNMAYPDSVSVSVSDVASDSFTLHYQYDNNGARGGMGGASNGNLYYAVTTTDIYGLNLPTDVKSGRGALVNDRQEKKDANTHDLRVTVPLTPGKAYFLWIATSNSDGQGLTLVTQNPVVLKVPDPTIANVKVLDSSPSYVNFKYELNSYVPATGKILYAISRQGMYLKAFDVKTGKHSLCYGEYDEGSTDQHQAHVNCELAAGNYLLWVATDECGGGCGLSLSTQQGIPFSIGQNTRQPPIYNDNGDSAGRGQNIFGGMNVLLNENSVNNKGATFQYKLGATQNTDGQLKATHTTSTETSARDAHLAELSFVIGVVAAMLICGTIYYKRHQAAKQLNNVHKNPRDISLDSDVYILKEDTKESQNYI